MLCSPIFTVSQIYSFMAGVLSARLALSVRILVAGDLQPLPQTYPPRSSNFYLRNKMQTQRGVPCVVSNTDDAQRTVWNAWDHTEVLCADTGPRGYPLFSWKYFTWVMVHGENRGVEGRAGVKGIWTGTRHISTSSALTSAFSSLCQSRLPGGSGGAGNAGGRQWESATPLWVQPTRALNTGLHGWMISALNNHTALSQHLITRTKQSVIMDMAE